MEGHENRSQVEFVNPRNGDRFLVAADGTKTITRGDITIELDDSAIARIRSKGAKGGSPGFMTPWLQAPTLKIHRLGVGGKSNATPCRGDAGERSERVQIWRLIRLPGPVTAIRRINPERDAASAEAGLGSLTVKGKKGQDLESKSEAPVTPSVRRPK